MISHGLPFGETMKKVFSYFKDNWLDIVAVVFSSIAIVFSWYSITVSREANDIAREANEIARQGLTGRLVVLNLRQSSATLHSPSDDSLGFHACGFTLRVANEGGHTLSLIGYDLVISYLDSEVFIEGTGEASVLEYVGYSDFPSVAESFASFLLERYQYIEPNQTIQDRLASIEMLSLPLVIQAGEAIDITTELWLITHEEIYQYANSYPQNEGYMPLEVQYIVQSADGSTATSTRVECMGIRQLEE